jgi:uncharacterized membrane protein YjjP (DUF1212 family)
MLGIHISKDVVMEALHDTIKENKDIKDKVKDLTKEILEKDLLIEELEYRLYQLEQQNTTYERWV